MAVLVGITMSELSRTSDYMSHLGKLDLYPSAGLPLISEPTGCAYQGILKASALFWIPGLIFEPILFGLVAYKAWDKNVRIPLITRMAKDSMMYFVV